MNIERMKWITRSIVRANPDKIFLFGDNYERRGMGGQAKEMRGEPNAYGISTKSRPDNQEGAFLCDDNLRFHAARMYAEFEGLKQKIKDGGYTAVVIPADGLGTGLARLNECAPKTFAYLQTKLYELERFDVLAEGL